MTTIQTLQLELDRLQAAQAECVTEEGVVKSEYRYKYQMLVQKSKEFFEAINWMKQTLTNPTDRIE